MSDPIDSKTGRDLGDQFLIASLRKELAAKDAEIAGLRKALLGEIDNDVVWGGYYWLEQHSTVKLGLATIKGLYKHLCEASLAALAEYDKAKR